MAIKPVTVTKDKYKWITVDGVDEDGFAYTETKRVPIDYVEPVVPTIADDFEGERPDAYYDDAGTLNITVTKEFTVGETEEVDKPTEKVAETNAPDYLQPSRTAYTEDGRIVNLPIPNSLRKFASYNYKIGMYALTDEELNDPDATYRIKKPRIAIFQSGGGLGDKKVTTAYEVGGQKVEFFIQALEFETIIAPTRSKGATNATSFRLEIQEPYSMGLFLQAMQVAAFDAGHTNYTQSPFLLVIEFIGWDQDGNPHTVPSATKRIPFKLVGSGLQVTQGGSAYTMEGVAYNEAALSDQVQRLPVDVTIAGRTLESMLQSGLRSLTTEINDHLLKASNDDKVKTADQYIIVFPKNRATAKTSNSANTDSGDRATDGNVEETGKITVSAASKQAIIEDAKTPEEIYQKIAALNNGELPEGFDEYLSKKLGFIVQRSALGQDILDKQTGASKANKIGQSQVFNLEALGATQQPFGLAGLTWDKEKKVFKRDNGGLQIDPGLGTIKFLKGTRIQDVIEEMITISEYGRALPEATVDKHGFKDWFRIDTQVFQVSDKETEQQIGRKPRIYVYRVLPFKVHESRFIAPTQSIAGIAALKKQVCKSYNYIYSGQNEDIIDVQINLDNTFFKSISPGNFPKTDLADGAKAGEVQTGTTKTKDGDKESIPEGQIRNTENTDAKAAGAYPSGDPKIDIARRFNEAIVNSNVDMITLDMQIWGDPYYIADSGVGNYNSENTSFINVDSNGAIDYQSGEIDVEVNFRTPVDIRNSTGLMKFPDEQISVNTFSGLYQVIKVDNVFRDGQFTQTLDLVRRGNQYVNKASDQSDKKATEIVPTDENGST